MEFYGYMGKMISDVSNEFQVVSIVSRLIQNPARLANENPLRIQFVENKAIELRSV